VASTLRRVPTNPIAIAPGSTDIVPAQQASRYLKALRRRWWMVAVLTATAVGAALAVSLTSQKEYDATAKVLLSNSEPVNTIFLTQPVRAQDSERDVNTDVALVRLDAVARRVQRRLGLPLSTSQLLDEVRASTAGITNVISITARDLVPARAQAIANAFAAAYVAFRRDNAQAQYEEAAARAARQLAAMTPEQRNSSRGKALANSLQDLQTASKLVTGGVQIAERATLPTHSATPRTKLVFVVALLLGLFVGALGAIALEFTDRRLRDEADVEEFLGLPILAKVPAMRRWRGPDDDGSAQQEAYATVAVNLRLRDPDSGPQTVMIISAEPEAGKTSVTIGVARALARAAQRVVAIECDLRRPTFANYLGLDASGGLAAVLGRMSSLRDELVDVDSLGGPTAAHANVQEVSLDMLPAGSVVANPHAVLPSDRMREILAEARSSADIVLIDTPALAQVSDAVDLVGSVDTCIFVIRVNWSTREGSRRALRTLREVGLDVIGIVVTGATADQVYGHDYQVRRPPPKKVEPGRRLVSPLARWRRRAEAPSRR
jgi:succinoglycan biosynthesis transport protein ExoP